MLAPPLCDRATGAGGMPRSGPRRAAGGCRVCRCLDPPRPPKKSWDKDPVRRASLKSGVGIFDRAGARGRVSEHFRTAFVSSPSSSKGVGSGSRSVRGLARRAIPSFQAAARATNEKADGSTGSQFLAPGSGSLDLPARATPPAGPVPARWVSRIAEREAVGTPGRRSERIVARDRFSKDRSVELRTADPGDPPPEFEPASPADRIPSLLPAEAMLATRSKKPGFLDQDPELLGGGSTCPPNCFLMAERSLSAKLWARLERKRA